MPRSQDDVLLFDLLDRVRALEERQEPRPKRDQDERERRLVVTLAGVDRSVREYRRKQRGEVEWSTFDLPEELAA